MARPIKVEILGDATGFEKAMMKVDAGVANLESKVSQVTGAMSNVGTKLTQAVTVPVLAAGAGAFKMAADYEDAVGAVGQVFGNAADDVTSWANNLESYFGVAKGEALEHASIMGSLLQNIGGLAEDEAAKTSATLVELAADLSATFGGSTESAVQALTGALKGNTTMLDNYGMSATQAQIEAKALEMGIWDGAGAMDQQAKQAAVLALVMEQSTKVQGQATREAEGASGQMKAFSTDIKNLATDIGTQLIPVGTELIAKVRGIMERFSALSPEVQRTIVVVAGIAAAIGPVLIVMAKLVNAAMTVGKAAVNFVKFANTAATASAKVVKSIALKTAAMARAAAQAVASIAIQIAQWVRLGVQSTLHAAKVAAAWVIAMGPIAWVIAAIAGLVALIIVYWDDIKRIIEAGWNYVKEKTESIWNAVISWLSSTWESLKATVSSTWNTIKQFISDAWESIKNNTQTAIDKIVTFFSELPGKVVDAIKAGIQALLDVGKWVIERILEGIEFYANAAQGLFAFFTGLPGKIKDLVLDGASTIFDLGKDIVSKIIDGIEDVAGDIGAAILDAIPGGSAIGKAIGGIDIPFIGDGPGAPSVGGSALSKVQRAIAGTGARISSTYRSPEHNRRVGGSPTSYHMDRNNPAVDIVHSSAAVLDSIYARLVAMGGWRELLWRVPNHAPGDNMHIHAAHSGEFLKPSSPGWMPGLAKDERLRVLQVGEVVLPKNESAPKGDTYITVSARTNADPHQIARDVAWALKTAGR